MLDMPTPYLDMCMNSLARRYRKPVKIHRATCPSCNKKLVTLYFSAHSEKYICKQCVDRLMGKEASE